MRVLLALSLVVLTAQTPAARFVSFGGVYHLSTCSVAGGAAATTVNEVVAKRMSPCIVCHPEQALARARDAPPLQAPLEAADRAAASPPPASQTAALSVMVATRSGDVIKARLSQLSTVAIVLDVAGQKVQLPFADISYISFVGPLSAPSTAGPSVTPNRLMTSEPPAAAAPAPTAKPATSGPRATPATQTARVQCAAITQKWTRCSRRGRGFCVLLAAQEVATSGAAACRPGRP